MENLVLHVPKWEGEIKFNYTTVHFILVIATLLVGLVLCFMGYKYMHMLCFAVLGCLIGVAGIRITDGMTQNPVLKMFLFVIVTSMGVCFLYGLSLFAGMVLRKLHLKGKSDRYKYLIAAFLGAGIVGMATYWWIVRNLIGVLLISVVLFIAGAFWGKKHIAKQKIFHTYDELYERKPLTEEGGASCSMSVEEN